MKRFILVFAVILQCMFSAAQEIAEVESYGSDNYIGTVADLPLVRNINGGTVFNITYEGKWTNEMKGAFEYACKIWEESLPNCLPINITARIGAIRGTSVKKPLSKVGYTVYYDQLGRSDAVLSSRIKGTMMREYTCSDVMHQFVDSINEISFLAKPDIILTYNKDRLDDFSFSLEPTPVEKYDFVTMVLRDIAKAMGFSTNITADKTLGKINYTGKKLTPFEELVVDKLGKDPFVAYQRAIQQKLEINISNSEKLSLYAPSEWTNGISLNAFIPDSIYRITELLTYDYGRGTVIRDIHDSRYPFLFEKMLKWEDWTLTTGASHPNASGKGKTSNLIPFDGNITINTSLGEFSNDEGACVSSSFAVARSFREIYDYMSNFSYYLNRNGSKLGWKIAILKKDGTWDIVYENRNVYLQSLNVGLRDLEFHEKVNDYARTCDGYLRCRITRCVEKLDYLYNRTYYPVDVYYYVLDYLPQKIDVEYEGVVSDQNVLAMANDYTDDIKIGIKNLEGVKHVMVEQMDEGSDMPMRFEVKDFKKGFFIATVDKELYTQFKVIAINDNGQTVSDLVEVAPTDPSAMDMSVVVGRDAISVITNTRKKIGRNLCYEVFSVGNLVRLIKKGNLNSELIDIASLAPGNYVLKLYDKEHKKKKTFSFLKK